MIECISAMLDHYIFLSEDDSYLRIIKDDKIDKYYPSFPKLSDLTKIKIKDISSPIKDEENIQEIR
jgi:hypothetical protein